MISFTGEYKDNNFVYSNDTNSLRMQLISILNTPKGSRWYYPTYGSYLNEYKFSVLNFFTINIIGNEIKDAIDLIDGVTLSSINYTIDHNKLIFDIDLIRSSDKITIKLSVVDGVAS